MKVYRLYHIRPARHEGEDNDEKLIGIYTTDDNAKAAITRLCGLPGFKDFPDGFQIFDHELDTDDWIGGFISADEVLFGNK